MKLPAYPRTKPSGVEWLGDAPEHWEMKRSDAIVSADRSQLSPEAFADREVFHYSIPVVQETGTGQVENGESIASAKQVVKKPVVLVSKLNPRKATICLAKPQAILTLCSTEFVALNADKCELVFLEYLTRSELFRQGLDSKVQSVTRSHQRANPADIYKFWNAWPTLEDQRDIAAFLDRETGRVDRLVAKKQELIERLKEKRTALISRTVTRGVFGLHALACPPEPAKAGTPNAAERATGLPENPPLKPSALDWLGDIPKHWGVVPLRYAFYNLDHRRIPVAGEDRANVEKIYPYYGASGIIDHVEDYLFDETLILVAEDGANLLSRSTPLAFLATGKYWVNNHAHILKPIEGDIRYWAAVLQTYDYTPLVTGAAQPKLTSERLGSIRFPKPPPKEQAAIAAYLDLETAKLDALVGKVEMAVERLQEYRTALITAAVTGNIDVRKAPAIL